MCNILKYIRIQIEYINEGKLMSEKKRNFLIHGSILAMAGILVRIIGMLYRIPLVNIIGSEGNGIYSAAYNVYNIMLVLSAYGLPMAVSKLVSARFAQKQYKNAAQIFRCALTTAICTGGVAALILFFGAGFIERVFYKGVSGIAIPLRILAPTIFIVAILGVMRGFYQGQENMIPTAVSQLAEQIVNAAVSIIAGYILVNTFKNSANASAYGAAGGTLGTAVGALTALVFLVILYLIYRPTFIKKIKHDKRSKKKSDADVYKLIAATMIPIILGQTFYQISAVIDDMMFSNMMIGRNISSNIANDLGNFNSSYSLLIGIPQGVASALSSSMLPSIVASYSDGKERQICSKITSTLKTNMIIAIPSFAGLVILGKPIIQLLFSRYDSNQGAIMLKLGAAAVIFYTLSTVTSSALQGIDRMKSPVKHSSISLVVHIVLVYILLKFSRLGIYAIVIGNATFPVLIFILNIRELNQRIGFRMNYMKIFAVPCVCAIIMGIAISLTYKCIYLLTASNIISLVISLIIAGVSYFGPMYMAKKKCLI